MLGPVFSAELRRAGRRGRFHVLRWLYAAWLIAQLVYIYDQTHAPQYAGRGAVRPSPTKAAGDFSRGFRDLVLGQQFVLVVLVTPAFVAGAITDEKTRGTLQGLLTAHVTPADVVLGKLFARCAQVGTLGLVPLPLLAFVGPAAGIPPEFLVILVGVTAVVLFGLGGLSLLASVWFRQTRTAVMLTYLVLLAGWSGLRFADSTGWVPTEWAEAFNPVHALRPALDRDDPGEAFRRLAQAAAVWGGLGLVTTALAVWRLRPAYLRQMEARPRKRLALGGAVGRPRPTRDPLAWKERFVGIVVPPWLGVPVVAAVAAAITFYVLDDSQFVSFAAAYRDRVLGTLGGWVLFLATVVVGVRCSGSITGERERQTWEGLMTTSLTVEELVRGKLRGILRSTWPYVLAFWFGAGLVGVVYTGLNRDLFVVALVAIGLAGIVVWRAPRWGASAATTTVLAVAGCSGIQTTVIVAAFVAATWLAMYFIGAVGLYCSAWARSSWRSLLGTIAFGYAGGFALFCVASPVGCLAGVILSLVAAVIREAVGVTRSRATETFFWELWPYFYVVGTAVVFWLVARAILSAAMTMVAKSDRIAPNWVRLIEYDQPWHGPRSPRRRIRR
jgi:ABC-type transport system involved in multi-copper enzyme maturation permease subunit